MANQVTQKNNLRKLTDTFCKYRAHHNFLNICLKENLIPRGMIPNFGFSALPDSPYLLNEIQTMLKHTAVQIVKACKETYLQKMNTSRLNLDKFLYNTSQVTDFQTFEKVHQLKQSFLHKFSDKYWKSKKHKLRNLRTNPTVRRQRFCQPANTINPHTEVTIPQQRAKPVHSNQNIMTPHDSQTYVKTFSSVPVVHLSTSPISFTENISNTTCASSSDTSIDSWCDSQTLVKGVHTNSQTYSEETTGRTAQLTSSEYPGYTGSQTVIENIHNVSSHNTHHNSQTSLKEAFSTPDTQSSSQTLLKAPSRQAISPSNPNQKLKKPRNRRFKRGENNINNKFDTTTVYNLSDIPLTQDQVNLLSLGPKFCPTPGPVNKKVLLADIQEGCRKVRLKEFFHEEGAGGISDPPPKFYKATGWTPPHGRDYAVDEYCSSILNQADTYEHKQHTSNNLPSTLRIAIKQLKQLVITRKIRISKADKGGAVVIQNVDKYIAEAHRQLQNPLHYTTLRADPTTKTAQTSNNLVEMLHENGHITEKTKDWAMLNPSEVRPQQFYHLPKIHKSLVDPPGRPITSGVGGPTEKLSKIVDSWLQELVHKLPSHVKDSTHFLNILNEWNQKLGPFPPHTKLVTIDVVGLYTNIPHQDIYTAIDHFTNINNTASIPPADTTNRIVHHILTENIFQFEDTVYKQVHGTAMGTPMAPSVANLFMGWLEDKMLSQSPVTIDIHLWKRFIDDIFLLWTRSDEELEVFLRYINTFHPTIKFTYTISEIENNYLDILVKLVNSFIQTDLYTKSTDAHNYLHNKSCHPNHCLRNIPYSQMLRARRICSTEEAFEKQCKTLTENFLKRGYKQKTIEQALEKARAKTREETLRYNKNQNKKERIPFVITHNPKNPPLRVFLKEKLPVLHQSPTMIEAAPEAPILGERNCKSLQNLLMPSMLPKFSTLTPGSHKCKNKCIICRNHLIQTATVTSDNTQETYTLRTGMNCQTSNLIYILSCQKCTHKQYIGETQQTLYSRLLGHRSDINVNAKHKCPHVVSHFNSAGHTKDDLRVTPLEIILTENKKLRKEREKMWIQKFRTQYPLGLNEDT